MSEKVWHIEGMKKKIAVNQLRLGMFIDEFCGSWMDHPFWKNSFKVEDAKVLAQIQASPIKELWIDTHKGLDVAPLDVHDDVEVPAPAPIGAATARVMPAAPIAEARAAQEPPTSLGDELQRARKIVGQARGAVINMFQDVRMGKAIDAEHCLPLVEDISRSVGRNPGALVSLARLKTSDDYTYMHSVAVCALMVALAKQLNLSEADTREAGLAGLLHDLGKAVMPPEVLNKPGKLTDAEFTIMKSHPVEGHKMLLEAKGAGEIPLDVCLHHHEKMNGSGYPHRLKAGQISLYARMGAVCDVYDAITSNRPYKAGWDPAESVLNMVQWTKDGHFDDQVFQAFVRSIGIYPIGSLVRLKSGRLGVVIEQGENSLTNPIVKAFFSTKSNEPIMPVVLALGTPGCSDQIVARESPSAWNFPNLDDLWTS